MKSFKEFAKDTIFTYEWSEFCNWPEERKEELSDNDIVVFGRDNASMVTTLLEGPQNTWSWIRHRMKSMKVSELDAHHRKIAIRLSRVVNKRTEVLLFHPKELDLLILQKKVVGRDLPDAVDWRIIEK